MKTKKKGNYGQYFAIEKTLRELGDDTPRADLILSFSSGTCDSLKDFSEDEYKRFIAWLRQREYHHKIESPVEEKKNKIRRKIIALFCKMDWKTPDGKADIERIECWSIKYGRYGKRLNDHSLFELTQLCFQVERVHASFIKGL